MEVGNYKFHRRAITALQQLDDDEQTRVLEALAALVDIPVPDWPAAQAKRLPGDPPRYLVRVDDSLRLFVLAAAGKEPEVLDVVRRETLDTFAQAPGKNGN